MTRIFFQAADTYGLVGTLLQDTVYLENDGAPATSATVTYTLVSPTGTTLVDAAAATELTGTGYYYYLVDGVTHLSTPGVYSHEWRYSAGALDVAYDGPVVIRPPNGPILPRYALRHRIARRVGDLTLGVCTSSSGTTDLKDTDRTEPNNHWRGATLHIYAGTNAGEARTISSFTQSGGAFTLGKAFTSTPTTSSRYELHGAGGRGWAVAEYNDAINAAIEELAPSYTLPISDESVTLTTDTYEYTIPAGFAFLQGVWARDTSAATNDWYPLSRGDYRVLPGRKLRVPGATTNYRLRLLGAMRPVPLVYDYSLCDLETGWLVNKAASILWQSKVTSPQYDRDGAQAQADRFYQWAERLRPTPMPLVNAVRVT